MKTITRRGLSLLLTLVMIMGATSTAFAAPKSKTVKNQKFETKVSVVNKKAATVKKGTTNLTIKKGQGYIKFKAPKTKTYKFTFSNMKDSVSGACAYVSLLKVDKSYKSSLTFVKAKTAGGKTDTLWMSVNGVTYDDKDKLSRPIATRTATIKLKKGEVIYFYINNSPGKTKAKLKIK